MALPPEKRLRWILFGVVMLGAAAFWVHLAFVRLVPATAIASTKVEVARARLELRSDRLYPIGSTEPFTGWMVEHHANGTLRSRSAVTGGLLHGLSQGWYTNGQLQVSEYFEAGASHGLRTKWRPDGTKLSEAVIRRGRLEGSFRQWHENGSLAEHVYFDHGRPNGCSRAYHSDGSLKAEVTMENGRVLTEKRWKKDELSAAVPPPPEVSASAPNAGLTPNDGLTLAAPPPR